MSDGLMALPGHSGKATKAERAASGSLEAWLRSPTRPRSTISRNPRASAASACHRSNRCRPASSQGSRSSSGSSLSASHRRTWSLHSVPVPRRWPARSRSASASCSSWWDGPSCSRRASSIPWPRQWRPVTSRCGWRSAAVGTRPALQRAGRRDHGGRVRRPAGAAAGAPEALARIAEELAGRSGWATFFRGIAAGALLTLLSFLLHAADRVGRAPCRLPHRDPPRAGALRPRRGLRAVQGPGPHATTGPAWGNVVPFMARHRTYPPGRIRTSTSGKTE